MPSKRRVLIVDDDSDIRELLGSSLRKHALQVDEAFDGAEALRRLAENRYAVVLLDLLMPSMGGLEFLDRLAELTKDYAPVVLVVTDASPSVIAGLDPRRIHGVIRKPFDPQEVAAVVSSCTEIAGMRRLEMMCAVSVLAGYSLAGLVS